MKNVYVLSKEQGEELLSIQDRISCCVNLSYDELQGVNFDSKIYDLLDRIDALCLDMKKIIDT